MSLSFDYFLNDPELKRRHEAALPTDEMYRFFPPQDEILLPDSNPKDCYRFIFNGQPKTDYENKKLLKFKEYELKNGKINYPSDWLESDTMRILQASEYDVEKTYEKIKENIAFLNGFPKTINNKIVSLLNSGFLYVYGRDHHFRPIIVCSIKTCTDLLSKNLYTQEDVKQSIIYLLLYIMKYLFIPGQIENWVILVNFDDVGISDISDFKQLFGTLSVFRGRVFRNYFINLGGFVGMAVKTGIKVFGSSTAKKLKVLSSDELHKMHALISPDNIEKKYGGTAPDVVPGTNALFPPVFPSKNFAINGEKLNIVSEEAYKEMCLNSKPFKPFVISPRYQELWRQENEKESIKTTTGQLENEKKENLQEEIMRERERQRENERERERAIMNERIRIEQIRRNSQIAAINKKMMINEFLKEFNEVYILEDLEEKKYYSQSPNYFKEIDYLFKRIHNNKVKKFL